MSALSNKIEAALKEVPMVVCGKKLAKEEAESLIWKSLADSRIGVLKDDPETHSLLNPDLISEKDFRTVFCDEGKFALPSVRGLMKHVLAKTDESSESSEPTGGVLKAIVDTLNANKPIGQYKTRELLENYNADSPQEIWTELEKRAKNQNCMVFNKDGSLNVNVSLDILQTIRKGQSFGSVYNDGEKTYRVYPVGVFPEDAVLCCPITSKILNNGYCSDLGISWKGVDEDCMVFIRVVRDNREGVFSNGRDYNVFAVKTVLKTAKEGLESLREEFPEEALVYDDFKKLNQLPSLRVNLNSMAAGRRIERKSDPFGSPKRS